MNITFLIPVCNERDTIESLVEAILLQRGEHASEVASYRPATDVRILFVDDGSTDGTLEKLRALHACFPSVDFIRFRRNLGKSAALAAGFARAEGDVVITMDGDLQDDPREIPRFLAKLDEGFDVVVGWKSVRYDPWHKVLPSRLYNAVVARLFGVALHDVNCGYKALRIDVVKNLCLYGDLHRLIPVLAADLGYRVTEIPVTHHPRQYGVSKYGIERFARGAADVFSTFFLTRHLDAPGHFFFRLGLGAAVLGLLLMAFGIAGGSLFSAGIVLLGLGLVAELIVKQHRSAKSKDDETAAYICEEHIHDRTEQGSTRVKAPAKRKIRTKTPKPKAKPGG